MIRPDDSLLSASQLATVRRHADLLLRDASAFERFPTPVDDLMAAAKLTIVDDEVLNENFLRQFIKKAKSGLATIKSALSKVLGLYESHDRLVVIDKDAPKPRRPFILRKLQEQHNDVVNAAQKLLEEVTRYRRMQAIWTARVLQRANRNEFADVEYVEVPE